jgi:hypothetical protein
VKGRKSARLASLLADEVIDRLVRAGCEPPPRHDVVGALWPAAVAMVRAQKQLRCVEALHRRAAETHDQAEVACLAGAAAIVGGWQEHHPPALRPVPVSRLVAFDPAATSAALSAVARPEPA